jgi:hypothetical protein
MNHPGRAIKAESIIDQGKVRKIKVRKIKG